MKILVTGAKGQVGSELVQLGEALGFEMLAMGRTELDITKRPAVNTLVRKQKPNYVINAAAYTAVDRAELEPEFAYAINRDGAACIAQACADNNIPLVHISTDYVFDGYKIGGYNEMDSPNPRCVYGKSKLAGERAIESIIEQYLILRVSWVFGANGSNFVKTMLRLGVEREEFGVVADQLGKPTSASEIARVILEILPKVEDRWGVFHLAQPEVVSWHGFASAVFDEARSQGVRLKVRDVKAIETADYPTTASRPLRSELSSEKLEAVFGLQIRPWKKSLSTVIGQLNDDPTSTRHNAGS